MDTKEYIIVEVYIAGIENTSFGNAVDLSKVFKKVGIY